jgi:hypothetical protein
MIIDFQRKNGKMALLETHRSFVIYQEFNYFDEWFRF